MKTQEMATSCLLTSSEHAVLAVLKLLAEFAHSLHLSLLTLT